MAQMPRPQCDHWWVRDDANTKQCLKCHTYAPIKPGDFD